MPAFKFFYEITFFPLKVSIPQSNDGSEIFLHSLATSVFSILGLFLSTALICTVVLYFLLYLPSLSNEEVVGEV